MYSAFMDPWKSKRSDDHTWFTKLERSRTSIMDVIEYAPTTTPPNINIDHTMKMRTREKPHSCPWCGSEKIALLLSGMPVFIPELENALDSGGVAIGSIKNGHDEPAWQCTDCCAQFFRDTMEDPSLF